MPDETDVLHPFGISATTGKPLNDLTDEAVAATVGQPKAPGPEEAAQAARVGGQAGRAFQVDGDTDPNNLSQAGWGVIFAPGIDQKIKDALQPLIDHRKNEGADPFVVYDPDGYRAGEFRRPMARAPWNSARRRQS